MPDDTNDVADVIRTALARLGWSQARLSKESGVDPNTISDLLNRSRTPRPETVERLYKALELDDAGRPAVVVRPGALTFTEGGPGIVIGYSPEEVAGFTDADLEEVRAQALIAARRAMAEIRSRT